MIVVMLAMAIPATAGAEESTSNCQGANVPVNDVLPSATMHGTLCVPDSSSPETVMVLVPGGTYNAIYWNFPYRPETYNFRLAMNEAGYATFVVDRLGSGESSRVGPLGIRLPLSAEVTATRTAAALHDVIVKLRNGEIGGTAFSKVIIGGHSLGSGTTVLHAANYDDVDAVLLTGLSHTIDPRTLLETFGARVQPAALDPQLASEGYDPGYVTLKPGARKALFYHEATTDPKVVELDEATKGVSSLPELADGIEIGGSSPYSELIEEPVLLANGDRDRFMCVPETGNCDSEDALWSQERLFYALSSCLQTFLLPGVGHNVNLATNTERYQQAVVEWADATVGAGPDTPPH